MCRKNDTFFVAHTVPPLFHGSPAAQRPDDLSHMANDHALGYGADIVGIVVVMPVPGIMAVVTIIAHHEILVIAEDMFVIEHFARNNMLLSSSQGQTWHVQPFSL